MKLHAVLWMNQTWLILKERNNVATKTVKIEGTIYISSYNVTDKNPHMRFIEIRFDSDSWKEGGHMYGDIKIAPYTIEIEMPEGFDVTKEQINALQNQRKLILADNEKRLNLIDQKIQEFIAIEHK